VTPPPIPLVRVSGSHRDVGRGIGRATAAAVRQAAARAAARGLVAAAAPYREMTAAELPCVVAELDGVAEDAGADPAAVFAASVEELAGDAGAPSQLAAARALGRCSDLVARPPATADGHVWVAHTNDLDAESEEWLVAIERDVDGDPRTFTIGIGPWLSVGWNAAGLSLTGNEVTATDERPGIPRLLAVREVLRRRTLVDGVRAALHPRRASSYNNVLAHRDGGVVSVEASATDAELLEPGADGTLVHTNHYVSERMRRYEGDPVYARRSAARLDRARERIAWAVGRPGGPRASTLRRALADHTGGADALCRHPGGASDTKTVFWCVCDVTEGVVTYGRGNPCDSEAQRHVVR
jgi:isopenicillin-N N-acyltransferase like protein